MNNTYAQTIKNAIVNDLQTLLNNGTIGEYQIKDNGKINPFDRDYGAFPSAISIPPTVSSSEMYDTTTNLREYTFWVAFVTKPENIPSDDPTYLERLMDSVMDVFDTDVTLRGSAPGGSGPAILEPPGVVATPAASYTVFFVTIKARVLVEAAVHP